MESEKDLLFRLKTRRPSKRGFFIRTVINYLDTLQRAEREQNKEHEPRNNLAFFIEESQDAFNSRSQTRLESEEFLTVFNEARNQKEAFFTASQRLNDFSKTIRAKQIYCLGRINSEDMNPALRRIEKEHNIDLTEMPLRNWLFNGETFVSPDWKQQGKPYLINRAIREKWFSKPTTEQPKKPMPIWKAALISFFAYPIINALNPDNKSKTQSEENKEQLEDSNENSQADGLFTDDSENNVLFPEEEF